MNKPFKPMKARFRASFAAGGTAEPRLGNIDQEAEILHDVQITLEGEAKGHGVWLDRKFCEDVAAAGNKTGEAGVKVRFGHPAMCSDALGTYLGRAKNFRVVDLTRKESGEAAAGVVADIHIAPESHSAPSGDLGKWVMEASANSPDTFGQSIVFTYSDWKVKDADGNDHSYSDEVEKPHKAWCDEHKDATGGERSKKWSSLYKAWSDKSADGRTYAVLGNLLGTDFTDTPAATDGVFSSGDLASEAEEMLDEHPQILETLERHPESVVQFLERTGLAEKIESARLSGLQAAKDKEIGALKEQLKAAEQNAAALSAKIDDFKKKVDDAEKALAKASSLESAVAEKDQALAERDQRIAELGEQLEHLEKTRSLLTGNVLTPGSASEKFSDFASAVDALGYVEAAKKYPELKKSYRVNK